MLILAVGRLVHRSQQPETPRPNPPDSITEHMQGPGFKSHTSSPDAPPQFPMNFLPKFEPNVKRVHIGEEEALARAIALSEKELKDQIGRAAQEEEDIAKAIEESLRYKPSFGTPVPSPNVGSSTFPKTTSTPSFSSPLPELKSPIPPQTFLTYLHTPRVSTSLPVSRVSSPSILPTKPVIGDDGTPAQRFAERVNATAPNLKPASLLPSSKSETTTPPVPVLATAPRKQEAQQYELPVKILDSEPPPPLHHHVVSANTSILAETFPNSHPCDPSPGKSTTASAVFPSNNRHSPIPDKLVNRGPVGLNLWMENRTTSCQRDPRLHRHPLGPSRLTRLLTNNYWLAFVGHPDLFEDFRYR